MKKLFGVLLVFFYSCTTTNDGNSNAINEVNLPPTTLVPLPPTNLIEITSSSTSVNLSWTDNSTNETGFIIERRTSIGNYAIVGKANTNILTFIDNGLTPGTNYVYRVYSYNAIGRSITYSNEIAISPDVSLNVSTTPITIINFFTASSGGNVSSIGGTNIISKGIVWSTKPNPTIDLITKTNDGTTSGVFLSDMNNLLPNTDYHVRAYATNNFGTWYGEDVIFNISLNYNNIKPIVQANCVACHSVGNQYPNLENFAEVKDAVMNGNLFCRIDSSCGPIMPPQGSLPKITIDMIKSWATANFPQ
jgi:hypothetical protein